MGAQHTKASISATVTDQLQITSGASRMVYVAPSSVTVSTSEPEGSSDDYVAGSVIKLKGESVGDSGTFNTHAYDTTFYPQTKVKVTCRADIAGSVERILGTYTISSVDLTGTANEVTITLQESIPLATSTQLDCGSASCTAGNCGRITVTQVSHVIHTGKDEDTGADGATDHSVDFSEIIADYSVSSFHGLHVMAEVAGTNGKITWASIMSSAHLVLPDSNVATNHSAIVVLESESTVSYGRNNAAPSVGTLAGATDITVAASIDAGYETFLASNQDVTWFLDGKGTHENVECGARGLCDPEAGTCQCFAGYTGLACEQQQSLAM